MLRNLPVTFAAAILKLKFTYWGKNPTVNISKQLIEGQKLLIAMPGKIEHFGIALKSLTNLRKKLPKLQISVITKSEMVNLIDNRLKLDVVPVSAGQQSVFGLPKASILEHFQSQTYDLAIDLNVDFELFTTMLLQKSGASLKMALADKNREPFYNFQVRTTANQPLDKKYDALFNYILMMKDAKYRDNKLRQLDQSPN